MGFKDMKNRVKENNFMDVYHGSYDKVLEIQEKLKEDLKNNPFSKLRSQILERFGKDIHKISNEEALELYEICKSEKLLQ